MHDNALCYNNADPPELSRRHITPERKGTIDTMADLIGNEEDLKLLRQENETLRDQVSSLQKTIRVQEETIDLLREQIGLKDQLIATLQRETALLSEQMQELSQQVQEIEDQLKKDSFNGPIPSSVHFSRPPKSMQKKSSKKRG